MVTLKLNEQKELTMGKASVTYRGEAAAEEIIVSLPREIANTPLAQCVVTLNLNGACGGDIIDLTRLLQEDGEGLSARVTLESKHTAEEGNLDVWLEARCEGFCAKSNRVIFRIKPHAEIGETLPSEQVNLFSKWLVGASGLLSALDERIAGTEDAAESARVCYECAESALRSANTACAAAEAAYLAVEELKPPVYPSEEAGRAADTVLTHVDENSFSLAFFSDFHLGDVKRAKVEAESLPATERYPFADTATALFLKNAEAGTPENLHFKGNPDFVKNYAGSEITEGSPWCFEDPGTYSAYLAEAPQNGIIIFSQRDQLGSPTGGDRDVVVKIKIAEDGWYFPYFSYNLYNESAGANVYLAPVADGNRTRENNLLFSASNKDRPRESNVWEKHEVWGSTPRHLQSGEYFLVFEKTNDVKSTFRYFYLDKFCLHRIPTEQLPFDDALRTAGHLLSQVKKIISPDVVVLGGDYANGDWSTTKEDTLSAFRAVKNTLGGDIFLIGECDDTPYRSMENAITKREIYAHLLRENLLNGAVVGGFGYGYRDFTAQKMRVLFVNTEEKDESLRAEVRDGEWPAHKNKYGVSDAQLAFVEEAINVPDGWEIIVCSHRAPYQNTKLGKLLEKNLGRIRCCVHGHSHAYVEHKVGEKVFYIGCPNACDGQEETSSNWKIYEKTPHDGNATSGVIITISRKNGTIYADHIGAGFDRTFNS